MSVIEKTTNVQPLERAVFVTDDDRRARRLRRGAFAATALACLWLVGLGVGMFGFGSLPGLSLITPGHGKQRPDVPAQQQAGGDARLSQSVDHRRSVARQAQARRIARASALQQRAAAAKASPRSRPVTPPAAAAAVAAQQPVNPAQRQRGWARKGQPAPPGQLRTHPPPPATSRGQRRGQQTTTTTTTTPLPPGQAKKTPPPPPPPG